MPSDPKKPSLFGGFSDTAFITTDADEKKTDPYIKAEVIPSRYTGSNFKVGRPKKGHGKDVYFSHDFPTMAAADQFKPEGKKELPKDLLLYQDPGKHERRQAQERKKLNIHAKDFKYASFPKSSTGPGSHFGTFDGKPFAHMEDYKVQPRGEASTKKEIKTMKNVLTCPAKKGTYGYIGTTFSKYTGPEKSDEYDAVRKQELTAWKASKEKMIGNGVFKSTIRTVRTFDEKGSTGISKAFDSYEPPEETKKSKRKPQKPADDKSKTEDRKVFRYSSGAKSGLDQCLNKFPNTYMESKDGATSADPYDSAKLKAKEDKAKAKPYLGGMWKPVSGPKTAVVRTLLKTYY